MEQAEKDGVEPDEKLREAIERHMREGMDLAGTQGGGTTLPGVSTGERGAGQEADAKKSRTNGD